jgi:integrase
MNSSGSSRLRRTSRHTIDRLVGADRALVYRLAALTGLRAQELASLTPRSFDRKRPVHPSCES